MDWPRIAVVGAGAVGCYFGGMLARAGAPVVLIGRRAHMDAVAREGLFFEGMRFQERIRLDASTSVEQIRDASIVLFCVKTVDTEAAAQEIAPFLGPSATLLSLQNGVDNVHRIFRVSGVRAIPVAVYVAAAMSGPGHVKHTGRGDLVVGYRSGWPQVPDLKAIAGVFERAEIPCHISAAIETELWTKMAMNCAYNAISALTRARYGRILGFEPLRVVMQRAIAETAAVAKADGVSVPEQPLIAAAFELGKAMRGALSSTAQDIGRGRPTEIDSLNGYVSRRGAELGVATPINDTLFALVKLLEQPEV